LLALATGVGVAVSAGFDWTMHPHFPAPQQSSWQQPASEGDLEQHAESGDTQRSKPVAADAFERQQRTNEAEKSSPSVSANGPQGHCPA
jgi:hypothetical protein